MSFCPTKPRKVNVEPGPETVSMGPSVSLAEFKMNETGLDPASSA